jgi:hypothetical protein
MREHAVEFDAPAIETKCANANYISPVGLMQTGAVRAGTGITQRLLS